MLNDIDNHCWPMGPQWLYALCASKIHWLMLIFHVKLKDGKMEDGNLSIWIWKLTWFPINECPHILEPWISELPVPFRHWWHQFLSENWCFTPCFTTGSQKTMIPMLKIDLLNPDVLRPKNRVFLKNQASMAATFTSAVPITSWARNCYMPFVARP